ncbi:MAG TPA: response regulator [Acidobacteriaceae bacterium]|jgi:CheY-like chemotaxis protein
MADTTPSTCGSPPDPPGSGEVRRAVLIIDDDPVHLRIYGWILEAAGYRSITAMAHLDGIPLPDEPVDIVLLDYHLTGGMKATDAAVLIRRKYPEPPILLLSDAFGLPEDIAPLVNGFVRKGDPAKLIREVGRFLDGSP